MNAFPELLYSVDDNVARITMNRPDKLNAFTSEMGESMRHAFHEAATDDAVRVIVFTGAGRGFCAGADMGGLRNITSGKAFDGESGKEEALPRPAALAEPQDDPSLPLVPIYSGNWTFFVSCRKPVIAAVNGPAAGIGFVFSLYCDMRFAARSAIFTTAFAQRGLIAEHGVSWLLPRLVGPSNAMDLLYSARKVTAHEAKHMGLVNDVFDDAEFEERVMAYARTLASTASPRSLRVMKAQLWMSLHQTYAEALALADAEMAKSFRSEDFREGVAHFVEKRAARFTGR
ncbi:MAG: enoyl-CoA hydratase [Alphaproteobacteria bacterium]|nr:enoyl-CoA hydratase [Alphaproteobacteria bacterium]